MTLHITKNELKKIEKAKGYNGCKNCIHKSENPCQWIKQGGDGHLHLLCPEWKKTRNAGRRNNNVFF